MNGKISTQFGDDLSAQGRLMVQVLTAGSAGAVTAAFEAGAQGPLVWPGSAFR